MLLAMLLFEVLDAVAKWLIAEITLIAHFVFTLVFARADVSVLSPFEYTALVWATIIGNLVWLDFPSSEVWIGGVIIIACGLYMIHRESLPNNKA
ncbi:MAG: hypothetical protein DRR42_22715 [Gammaproteobacteria bacterium]|nr:MAG: hypothetical protein DRR42_22715 [Gammaproteobacteria bacterium]